MDESMVIPAFAGLPGAARLDRSFDVDRLVADLARLRHETWSRQRSYGTDGITTVAEVDWRILPLRSIDGSIERTDPGGPGLGDFQDSSWLDDAPYLAEILAGLPAQLRAVRLMALGPGAKSWVHFDNKYGLAWGTVRMHIPIVTYPEAKLFIEGELHQWQPGSFWFGDFTRMHQVENTGTETRVHLVIDALPSRELLELFPAEFRTPEVLEQILIGRPTQTLDQADAARLPVRFQVPESFTDWEEADGEFLTPQKQLAAAVELRDGSPVLLLDGEPAFALVHLGEQEFRLAGWTEERTVQLPSAEGAQQVRLRTRRGSAVRELAVPVEAA
ncbi:aspartyl/asparaginyl beta-hydroxylase domain-containing protein [Streptacidiphilus sp. N1-3]|uniref:Aspartyl/asparaginyl beta-hydroxylase domain-containing protein n=1 Tax=Streptacidiphilus alkalitolerans TaxID=3342712 RepID=A0ABV6X0P2_9ACTN